MERDSLSTFPHFLFISSLSIHFHIKNCHIFQVFNFFFFCKMLKTFKANWLRLYWLVCQCWQSRAGPIWDLKNWPKWWLLRFYHFVKIVGCVIKAYILHTYFVQDNFDLDAKFPQKMTGKFSNEEALRAVWYTLEFATALA